MRQTLTGIFIFSLTCTVIGQITNNKQRMKTFTAIFLWYTLIFANSHFHWKFISIHFSYCVSNITMIRFFKIRLVKVGVVLCVFIWSSVCLQILLIICLSSCSTAELWKLWLNYLSFSGKCPLFISGFCILMLISMFLMGPGFTDSHLPCA